MSYIELEELLRQLAQLVSNVLVLSWRLLGLIVTLIRDIAKR